MDFEATTKFTAIYFDHSMVSPLGRVGWVSPVWVQWRIEWRWTVTRGEKSKTATTGHNGHNWTFGREVPLFWREWFRSIIFQKQTVCKRKINRLQNQCLFVKHWHSRLPVLVSYRGHEIGHMTESCWSWVQQIVTAILSTDSFRRETWKHNQEVYEENCSINWFRN